MYSTISELLYHAYAGVNHSIPGTGGPECTAFLSTPQKILETIFVIVTFSFAAYKSYPHLRLDESCSFLSNSQHSSLQIKDLNNGSCYNGVKHCSDENLNKLNESCNRKRLVNPVSSKNEISADQNNVNKYELSKYYNSTHFNEFSTSRRMLLVLMCLIFGIELGYKLATQQLIWLLNPCHPVTAIQIYLLMAKKSKLSNTIFRLHIHCLSGATIALVLPVVNTRLLSGEKHVYYMQHTLMLIIPTYLIKMKGIYSLEPLNNIWWSVMSLSLLFLYHFLPLQLLAIASEVNLNSILCPAVSDPFYGLCYRQFACLHQPLLILIHGKVYSVIAMVLLRIQYGETYRLLKN